MNYTYKAITSLGFLFLAANSASAAQAPIIAQNEFAQGSVKVEASSNSEANLFNVASPLTELYVYGVYSSNCGVEFTAGQSSTSCDHGGSVLQTAVLEIGYGGNPIVWMSGGILPSSASIGSTAVCITNNTYTWPCSAGQTIVGFLREYDISGNQNGLFRYQNTSLNSPFNTLSVQISIL